MGSSYEKISQAKEPSCEIFRCCEPPFRHTCAISQPPKPILQMRNELRIPQSKILHDKAPSCENFRSCEPPFRHSCAILQPPKPILQLRNELRIRLRNLHQAAKSPLRCKMALQLRKCQSSFEFLIKPLIS